MPTTELKIAYIGGGSRDWARKLMFDLALCSELSGEMTLYDIDLESARLNEQLGNWLQAQPGVVSRWQYMAVPTLEQALHAADLVVASIQPGTLEIMAQEIAIAEEHGLFFPVGDTTGAPGLARGLRSATIYEGLAHAIADICPNAWVINYTNPMSVCTRALTRVEPKLKVFGCCHEVFATQELLARLAGQQLGVSPIPSRAEIKTNVIGINHFTWFDRAFYREIDLLELVRRYIAQPGVLRSCTREEVEAFGSWFQSAEQVKLTLFQRFGLLAAAGDRHLVEFLPGFIRSPEELFRWGVIRTPVSWRIKRWKVAPQRTHDIMAGREPLPLRPSGEEAVTQIKALLGLGDIITNVNVENRGQISNLPLHAVVETNARFGYDEVRPISAGALPPGLQPWMARHVANQEMIIEAAFMREKDLAFQAVFNDPTNRLPIDECWAMFNQMLQAGRQYLPGWKI
jgi:alpha-galactosidase/6-phospho-beta-glucosidase family protein